jgi:hypothetical protein
MRGMFLLFLIASLLSPPFNLSVSASGAQDFGQMEQLPHKTSLSDHNVSRKKRTVTDSKRLSFGTVRNFCHEITSSLYFRLLTCLE